MIKIHQLRTVNGSRPDPAACTEKPGLSLMNIPGSGRFSSFARWSQRASKACGWIPIPRRGLVMILGIFLLCLTGGKLSAQPGDDDPRRGERIERLKRAFISEKLDLTVSEAEKFWPVYNDFMKLRKSNHQQVKAAHRKMMNPGITEKEVLAVNAEITAARKKEADNDGEFIVQVLPILGPEKTGRFIQLEEEFRRELMQRLRERKQERMNGPGPRR